ncbi:MarR family transcriptional regulator [Nocardioides sp. GY 10127]|uniref:MarR family winged helix-turn-helix transcriptional regulator n=1 Tax=Nocardioides sp. GY 10127 TaxID=2569762 RepID=UPI0010A7BEF1|nr:MarR family transcriptional regulator [Nocardioides sp. GY 10127]TIC86478.1 MarR family transcriptional regulator [Nocardioides sp. GY 10127]
MTSPAAPVSAQPVDQGAADQGAGPTDDAVVAARLLVTVTGRLRRRLRSHQEAGLTPSQTSVLSRLDKDGPASAAALAAAERVRPQSMAATLAALEQAGMISRSPDPDDGRRQVVTPTDEARAWLERRRTEREDWLVSTLRSTLDDEETADLVRVLGLLERAVLA